MTDRLDFLILPTTSGEDLRICLVDIHAYVLRGNVTLIWRRDVADQAPWTIKGDYTGVLDEYLGAEMPSSAESFS